METRTMDRVEALKAIEGLTNLKTKVITHNPRTAIRVEPDVVWLRPGAGGHAMELMPDGTKALAKFANIPESYGKVLAPLMFGQLATALLEHKGSYTVTLNADGKIISFDKPTRLPYLDPEKVFKSLEKDVPGGRFRGVKLMDDNLSALVDVVGERTSEVQKGYLAGAGATVIFSPINIKVPSVESFCDCYWCGNGATSRIELAEFAFTGGDGGGAAEFWPWFNSSVKRAYRAFDKVMNTWRQLMEQQNIPCRPCRNVARAYPES